LNVLQNIEHLIAGDESVDISLLRSYKFGEDKSKKYGEKYQNALGLVIDGDKKRRQGDSKRVLKIRVQKGIHYLETVIIDIRAQLLKLDLEIASLRAETDLSAVPQASIVQHSVEAICKDFFDEDYYKTPVSGKILDVTREIIRDQITEKKGLYKILFQFFYKEKLIHAKERK